MNTPQRTQTTTAKSPYSCLCPYERSFLWKHPGQCSSCHLSIPSITLPHGRWVALSPTSLPAATTGQNTLLETPGQLNSILGPSLPCTGTAGRQVWAKLRCPRATSVQQDWQVLPATTSRHRGFLCCRFLSSLHNSVLFLRHQSQQRFHFKQPQLPPEQCQAWGYTQSRLLHRAHSQCTASLLSKGFKLGLLHTFPSARLTPTTGVNWLQSSLKSSGEKQLHSK